VAAVTGLGAQFKIDLLDPQMCAPTLLKMVKREGIEL
jgi:hypothetical protein